MGFGPFNTEPTNRGFAGARWGVILATAATTIAINVTPVPGLAAGAAEPKSRAAFDEQTVTWGPCEGLDAALQCATLAVPFNYQAPETGTLTVTISRLPATDSSRRAGILLLNPGGPGGSGLELPLTFRDRPLAKQYDLVGFDPRGFGESTPVACEIDPDQQRLPSRPADSEFPEWTEAARADEDGCERAGKGLRPYINTLNTARDMDVIRAALHEEKINYLGFSYGTYLGAVYGSLFPGRLNRSVLDSSVDPNGIWRESFKAGAVAARANVDAWAEWVGQRNRTFGLGKSQAAVFDSSERVATFLHKHPVKIPFLNVVMDRTSYDSWIAEYTRDRQLWSITATIVRVLRALATGLLTSDAPEVADVGLALRRLEALGVATTTTPIGFYSNVMCEADWPTDPATYYSDMRLFRDRYPFGFGVAVAAPNMCMFRHFTPPEPVARLSRAFPVGLVVQGEADSNTAYQGGPAMADALQEPLVTVTDEGRHGQYLYSKCVRDIVDRYLVDGVLPANRVSCPGAPRPNVPADSAASRAASATPAAAASLREQVDEYARTATVPRVRLR